MAKPDGGPAFASHEQWNEWSELKAEYVPRTGPRGGMSLRDYFAAQAVAGLLAAVGSNGPTLHGEIAREAYKFADAMLSEREKD